MDEDHTIAGRGSSITKCPFCHNTFYQTVYFGQPIPIKNGLIVGSRRFRLQGGMRELDDKIYANKAELGKEALLENHGNIRKATNWAGISEKTMYLWIHRYNLFGFAPDYKPVNGRGGGSYRFMGRLFRHNGNGTEADEQRHPDNGRGDSPRCTHPDELNVFDSNNGSRSG